VIHVCSWQGGGRQRTAGDGGGWRGTVEDGRGLLKTAGDGGGLWLKPKVNRRYDRSDRVLLFV